MKIISAFPSPWVARFAQLPVLPGRSIIAPQDGDTAQLRDLANRILDRLRAGATGYLINLPEDQIWWETVRHTGFIPGELWPDDDAARLLEDWRCGR